MPQLIQRFFTILALVFFVATTACSFLEKSKPTTVIVSPPSGSRFFANEEIAIQSTSTDASGVTRVELAIDGAIVHIAPAPSAQGQPTLPVTQTWKTTPGTHTIVVRAYNAENLTSEPAAISVTVLDSPAPTATLTPSLITPIAPTLAAPLTFTPTLTNTACTDNAVFVADVTVPDGTNWNPGQAFNKIWRVRNTGCPWGAGYQLVFVSGDAMTTTRAFTIPNTATGATADLLVPMTAPATPGAHTGTWRLRNPRGGLFGTIVTVKINVLGAAPAPVNTPASTTCSGAPVISSFSASQTIITVGGRTTLTWGAVTNASSVEIDQGIGYVIAPGAILVLPTTTTVYTMTAYCGSESVTAQVKITVPYAIVGSVTNANPTESTGACPKTISFSADITVNDAGSVSYKWESSNSTNDSPTQSINFDGPGTKTVTTSWTLGGAGQTINDRWMRIHIFSPTEVTSNNATFTIKCN